MNFFDRFKQFVGFRIALVDHFWLADLEFIPFAAHSFDQNAQMEFTAPTDRKLIRLIGVGDAQGNVTLDLVVKTLAEPTRRSPASFSITSRKWRGVDPKSHPDCWLFDQNRRQRTR